MAIEPSKGIVILQVSWRFADYYKSGFSFSKSFFVDRNACVDYSGGGRVCRGTYLNCISSRHLGE